MATTASTEDVAINVARMRDIGAETQSGRSLEVPQKRDIGAQAQSAVA